MFAAAAVAPQRILDGPSLSIRTTTDPFQHELHVHRSLETLAAALKILSELKMMTGIRTNVTV